VTNTGYAEGWNSATLQPRQGPEHAVSFTCWASPPTIDGAKFATVGAVQRRRPALHHPDNELGLDTVMTSDHRHPASQFLMTRPVRIQRNPQRDLPGLGPQRQFKDIILDREDLHRYIADRRRWRVGPGDERAVLWAKKHCGVDRKTVWRRRST